MAGRLATASSFNAGALAALLLVSAAGCAAWSPAPAVPKGGIAETDETLNKPLRPAASPAGEKIPWYDMRNVLDPRSRDIERHLGV